MTWTRQRAFCGAVIAAVDRAEQQCGVRADRVYVNPDMLLEVGITSARYVVAGIPVVADDRVPHDGIAVPTETIGMMAERWLGG